MTYVLHKTVFVRVYCIAANGNSPYSLLDAYTESHRLTAAYLNVTMLGGSQVIVYAMRRENNIAVPQIIPGIVLTEHVYH